MHGELHQYALKIRQKIVNVGAKHQDCIAIAMNKSIYQVAAVLGTLYAGCIYVPIVADQEIERAKKILEITNANIVLTTVAENSEYMSGKAIIEVDALSDIKFETELPEYGLEDVAYIIFTSGSTGEPKGVTITHKIERFEFGNEKDREEKREQWSHCVFDLCKWPLYNIRISYVNKAFPRIHIDFDCIIMDAWSAKMMIAKIFEVYEGKIVKWGTYSFKQYCLEQKEYRETHPENAAYSYWRKRVTELPPAPDLPYKKKLSELCGHRFDRISQKFSREETSALYKLVKDNRVTPAALICTMYMKTLMQYSKNKEFSLNLTLFNRLPLSEEIYNLIGDFTNIGAIAYRQQKDFWQEVNFVQKQLWELVRYHSFDGTQILKMIDPMNRGKAILPVVFTGVLQGDRKTKGFLPNGISEGYAISQTPQVVLDYQATDFNGELLVNWDYVIDAFDVEMIHSMFSENIKGLRLLIYS